jgi:hypothetical protein
LDYAGFDRRADVAKMLKDNVIRLAHAVGSQALFKISHRALRGGAEKIKTEPLQKEPARHEFYQSLSEKRLKAEF